MLRFAGPGSLIPFVIHTPRGPDRIEEMRRLLVFLMLWKTWRRTHALAREQSQWGYSSRLAAPVLLRLFGHSRIGCESLQGRPKSRNAWYLVLLFTSLLAIPLARQSCLDATLFAGFEVVGVTLYFLDDVLLLHLPLKPAQRIFKRFAFLYANLGQKLTPPNLPERPTLIILKIKA